MITSEQAQSWGMTVAAFGLGVWSLISSHGARKESREARTVAEGTTVEILGPRGEMPTFYDLVNTMRREVSELGQLMRSHREEYNEGLSQIRGDVRSMSGRISSLENSVERHALTEQRIQKLESQIQRVLPPGDSKH